MARKRKHFAKTLLRRDQTQLKSALDHNSASEECEMITKPAPPDGPWSHAIGQHLGKKTGSLMASSLLCDKQHTPAGQKDDRGKKTEAISGTFYINREQRADERS